MKTLLKLEDLGLFGLSVWLFAQLDYSWWLYPALLLSPDLSVLGYLIGPGVGAATYKSGASPRARRGDVPPRSRDGPACRGPSRAHHARALELGPGFRLRPQVL